MSEALLDVNLLIAAVVENHADHERALKFIATLDRLYTTPTRKAAFCGSSLDRGKTNTGANNRHA